MNVFSQLVPHVVQMRWEDNLQGETRQSQCSGTGQCIWTCSLLCCYSCWRCLQLISPLLPDLCRLGWGCRRPAIGIGWFPAGRGLPRGPSCTPWRAQCASSLWAAGPRSTESSQQGARTWNLRGVHPTRSAPWSERQAWKCCDLKAVKLSRLLMGIQKAYFHGRKKTLCAPSQTGVRIYCSITHLLSNYFYMQILKL